MSTMATGRCSSNSGTDSTSHAAVRFLDTSGATQPMAAKRNTAWAAAAETQTVRGRRRNRAGSDARVARPYAAQATHATLRIAPAGCPPAQTPKAIAKAPSVAASEPAARMRLRGCSSSRPNSQLNSIAIAGISGRM